jgi:hypothetical protein
MAPNSGSRASAGREKPNRRGGLPRKPSTWRGKSEQNPAPSNGLRTRKLPADAGVFFLGFSLYRTYQELSHVWYKSRLERVEVPWDEGDCGLEASYWMNPIPTVVSLQY